jgi:large subunit ribosomal protein L19e
MKLDVQKKIAGKILKCSPSRIRLDVSRLEEIKESITKADIRSLIKDDAITKIQKKGTSGGRARKIKLQKRKGRKKGAGSRKGKSKARAPKKITWMRKVRKQRGFIQELKKKGLIDSKVFRELYMKVKGGFFRSQRHIKIFINEHGLIKK